MQDLVSLHRFAIPYRCPCGADGNLRRSRTQDPRVYDRAYRDYHHRDDHKNQSRGVAKSGLVMEGVEKTRWLTLIGSPCLEFILAN